VIAPGHGNRMEDLNRRGRKREGGVTGRDVLLDIYVRIFLKERKFNYTY
jgi:hypothetical protein